MNPPKVKYLIEYEGKDITADVSRYLYSLTYSDKSEKASDELSISLEDTDALWRGAWYPTKGDKISASIGYDDELFPCGTFTIDEIEFSGDRVSGDIVTIRALAAGVTKAVRTPKSHGYENQTLRQIAETVASRNGLRVKGEIADIRITRSTQNRETDLGYLRRISEKFGHIFSVRGDDLVFTNVFKIEGGRSVLQLDRTDLTRIRITDKTVGTFSGAEVKYRNPGLNRAVEQAMKESGVPSLSDFLKRQREDELRATAPPATLPTKDTLPVFDYAEDDSQAEFMAGAALNKANSRIKSGNFSTMGNPLILAGNTIELVGIGELSGKYYVEASDHIIDKSGGYTTDGAVRFSAPVSDDLKLPKNKRSPVNPEVEQVR